MLFIHITRLLYIQIYLISKDVVVKEMNVLICSRYDKLKGLRRFSLVDIDQH
jgi:hypothetical protein